MLVAQAALDEVEQRAVAAAGQQAARGCWGARPETGKASRGMRGDTVPLPAVLLLQLPAGHADHHAVGEGGLEAVPRELADHLADSQAVVLPHVVQEPQRVVLESGKGQQSTGL